VKNKIERNNPPFAEYVHWGAGRSIDGLQLYTPKYRAPPDDVATQKRTTIPDASPSGEPRKTGQHRNHVA